MTTRTARIPTRPGSSYQLLVPQTQCYKLTKPDHYSSNGKITLAELYRRQQNRHYFSAFHALILIVNAQHVMLFLWIGSQNDRVFLFRSGYRSASGDTVRIKHWVCHISSTVMVVKLTCLTVRMVFALTLPVIGHLLF